ncbi:hypothetical protein [Muribaculum intestinale]|nr:hypothetical protein [Muribaculum intestinale]
MPIGYGGSGYRYAGDIRTVPCTKVSAITGSNMADRIDVKRILI